MTDLITLEKANAIEVFTGEGAVDPYLEEIRKVIEEFEPDTTTKKGRDEIASLAHRVARSKTYLDGIGKELVDEYKRIPKQIDASRKKIRDTLDAWKTEVRQPLTDWEDAEKARIQKHKDGIAAMTGRAEHAQGMWQEIRLEQMREVLAEIKATPLGEEHWQEFAGEAAEAKDRAVTLFEEAISKRETHDAEQAELARLRKEEEERAEKERQERLERERAEREERIAKEAAGKAKREAEAKAEEERRRLAADKERAEKEAAARAADKEHRSTVNRTARDALIKGGLSEGDATLVVKLIAQNEIPNITIRY